MTVRRGPKVERHRCASLDEALTLVREQAAQAQPQRAVDAMGRRYEAGDLVATRIELKGPNRRAGLDVRGDGSIVAWTGRMRRKALDGDDPFAALRQSVSVDP